MATLARVDVDPVDLPHLQLETEPSHVSARPSREFSAYTDATLDLGPPPRTPWLAKTLFVSTMVGIIAAATVTAVRENAQEPWLAPWLDAAERAVTLTGQRVAALFPEPPAAHAAERGLSPEPASELAVLAPAAAAADDKRRAPAPALAASAEQQTTGDAEANERVRLPEVVFTNPEPDLAKQAALAPRPGKVARTSRVRPRAKERASARVSAPAASAVALSGNWEQTREAARTAYASGRYREALVAYEQAARMNPRHGLTLAGLGAARMQTGDTHGAVDAYKRAVATAPTNLTFLIALARAYERSGDDARARETYQKVLRMDANNVAAQVGLERL
jgi:tetratricopeptide (TPR) repeat protein